MKIYFYAFMRVFFKTKFVISAIGTRKHESMCDFYKTYSFFDQYNHKNGQ